jgi:hypothetical protein
MARRKKILFKLDPEWMFKEPIDFEYNKYKLLGYLQKCEKNFDLFQVYPDFIELSLHIANLQSLSHKNFLFLTNKKFESCDDEILLKDLYPKIPRALAPEEHEELKKTIDYSYNKLFDAFNIAKSIWTMAYDSVQVSLKKNKESMLVGSGFAVYHEKDKSDIIVWEYQIKRTKTKEEKLSLNKIYEGSQEDETLNSVIEKNSQWKNIDFLKKLPVFEIKCSQNLPFEETIIPLIKRKILGLIYQSKSPKTRKLKV